MTTPPPGPDPSEAALRHSQALIDAAVAALPMTLTTLDRAFAHQVDTRTEPRGMAAAILQLSTCLGSGRARR